MGQFQKLEVNRTIGRPLQFCTSCGDAMIAATSLTYVSERSVSNSWSCDLCGFAFETNAVMSRQTKSSTTRRASRKPRPHYRRHLNESQCRELALPLAVIDWTFTSCCGNWSRSTNPSLSASKKRRWCDFTRPSTRMTKCSSGRWAAIALFMGYPHPNRCRTSNEDRMLRQRSRPPAA